MAFVPRRANHGSGRAGAPAAPRPPWPPLPPLPPWPSWLPWPSWPSWPPWPRLLPRGPPLPGHSGAAQVWRWLRASFGTRWEAGRWRGGGSDPGQRLPRTDGDFKEQRDNCEGGGTLGANAAASAVPEPVALGERHSHCSAARSSHAPPPAGKPGVSVTVLSPPPTLLHHPMALALSCPRGPTGARTGVAQEGGFAVGLLPILCFLTGPLGVPAKPRHFWALWGAWGAPGARRRGWRSTQLAGSAFWSAQGCAGGRAAIPALSLVSAIHHLPKTTVPVNNFCFSSPKTPWRNFPVFGVASVELQPLPFPA